MFMVIAGNGKEYGPFDEAQVREWVKNGFLNIESKIKKQGDADWKTLADFPDLTAIYSSPKENTPRKRSQSVGMLWAPDYSVNLLGAILYLGRAVQFAFSNFLATLLVGFVVVVTFYAPEIIFGQIQNIFAGWKEIGALGAYTSLGILMIAAFVYTSIIGIVRGGVFYFLVHSIKEGKYSASIMQETFQNLKGRWTQLSLCAVTMGIIFMIAFSFVRIVFFFLGFFAIPFALIVLLYCVAVGTFSNSLVIDKKVNFWEAITLASSTVLKHWFVTPCLVGVFGFVSILGYFSVGVVVGIQGQPILISHLLIGMAICFITWPIGELAFAYLYDDIFN